MVARILPHSLLPSHFHPLLAVMSTRSLFPDPEPVEGVRFADYFCDAVAVYGEEIAIEDPATGETLNFDAIAQRIDDVRRRLIALGLAKGDSVGCLAGNSLSFVLLCLAAGQLDLTLFPLNPASKKYEIAKYLSGVRWLFIDEEQREKAEAVAASIPDLKSIFALEALSAPPSFTIEEEAEEKETFDSETTAFVFFSSGTTGPPKGIRIPHRALINHCQIARALATSPLSDLPQLPQLSSADVVYGCLPLFHAGGIVSLLVQLMQGARVILNGRYEEEVFVKTIVERKITVLNAVPAVLPVLSSLPAESDLSSLRLLFVGAAPVPPVEARALQERIPACQLVQMYGLTEAGVLVFMTPAGVDAAVAVGVPLPGVEYKILKDDDEPAPPQHPGELWLKTATMASGYWQGEDFPEWLDTGDVAAVDENGLVSIVGRSKDMIKVRGWQVSPQELEQAIVAGVPGVTDCAVVGVDFGNGRLPHAFVVGMPIIDEVINFVKDNFVSYKHLAGVSIVPELPRTETGKVQRTALIQTTTADDDSVFPVPKEGEEDTDERSEPVIL